jgi:hypothetical protein
MDVVILKGVTFYAIQGKSRIPIIKTYGLGPLLTGKQAKDKPKAKHSKRSGRHRKKKFFIKVTVIKA